MENLRSLFLEKIKNIPFVECVDENKFFEEFINSPKETINEELIINEILNGKNVDEFNSDDEKKFKAKVLEIVKTKNQKYYIPNIQKTETYKRLNEIWEVYYNFLKTITGNHKNNNSFVGKSLNIDEKINEPKDVDFDRYKEVKITISRILQLLNYFDINIQKLIIEILISDSGIKIFLSENNNIYKSVDPLIIHFKEKLSNKFSKIILENSTPKAPQNDNQKSNGIMRENANEEETERNLIGFKRETEEFIDKTLTMKKIALKFVFEKKQITEKNKNDIAADYYWVSETSGEKLKREYDYYQKRNNRIGEIKDQTTKKQKNRIELFESVLPLLECDTTEIKKEIEILKSKM